MLSDESKNKEMFALIFVDYLEQNWFSLHVGLIWAAIRRKTCVGWEVKHFPLNKKNHKVAMETESLLRHYALMKTSLAVNKFLKNFRNMSLHENPFSKRAINYSSENVFFRKSVRELIARCIFMQSNTAILNGKWIIQRMHSCTLFHCG